MDSHVSRRCPEMPQASANGILTMFATGNDRPNFFEISIADDCIDFGVSIFACNNNDLVDTGGALKCVDGMGDDRSASDRRKQFVETHAATVTGGDDDGGQHDRRVETLKG